MNKTYPHSKSSRVGGWEDDTRIQMNNFMQNVKNDLLQGDTTELLNWNRIGSLRIKESGDGRRWREQLTQRLEQFVKLVTSVFVVESDKTWTFRGFGGYGACV